jgi:hypothetical protein
MPRSIFYYVFLLFFLLCYARGYSQSLLHKANWLSREGQWNSGQVVLPDQLLSPSQNLLIKTPRGYERLRLQDIEWLAVGGDTVFRCYAEGHPLAGYWQLLAGGSYDLYLQRRGTMSSSYRSIPLPWPIGWIGMLMSKRPAYRYALFYQDQVDILDWQRPVAALQTLEEGDWTPLSRIGKGSRLSQMWRAGQTLNNCTASGISYRHPLRAARWELGFSTVLATMTRQPGEVRRHNWSGRFTLTRRLGTISRKLSWELAVGQFNYRQRLELEVTDRVLGVGTPFYTIQALRSPARANYRSSWMQNNTIFNTGLRWEMQPDAHFNLLVTIGAAYQLATTYRLEITEINDNPLPGVPIRTVVVREIPGGWKPYAALGVRMRLRHDWRLGLELRSEPVLSNLARGRSSDDFRATLQYHAESAALQAFSQSIMLGLTKVIY